MKKFIKFISLTSELFLIPLMVVVLFVLKILLAIKDEIAPETFDQAKYDIGRIFNNYSRLFKTSKD